MVGPPILIDTTRLIWRVWSGRQPTGIDRVCLAYLSHFQGRAQAVIQRKGKYHVLGKKDSERLFGLLAKGSPSFRRSLIAFFSSAWIKASRNVPRGSLYLNVGHTGLDDPQLPSWLVRFDLRAVYMIHDLIPLTHPEYCRAGEAERHRRRMLNVLDTAHGIISNSAATLHELNLLAEEAGRSMPANITAWLAGTPLPRAAVSEHGKPYFVVLGTIEGRKNHILLLQVWRRLIAELGEGAPDLLVIGQRGWEAQHAFAMLDRVAALQPYVRELGSCTDAQVASLLAGARALLMPSFAEGFGLPVVEALELGTPVIASDLPIFREIAGQIPTYVDPLDGPAWLAAVLDYLGDGPARRGQIDHIAKFEPPTWKGHFETVDQWLCTL
jgi:glycosyltransferase involved in cell wall biosynthesis